MSLKLSLDAIQNGKFVLRNRDLGCPSLFNAHEYKKSSVRHADFESVRTKSQKLRINSSAGRARFDIAVILEAGKYIFARSKFFLTEIFAVRLSL